MRIDVGIRNEHAEQRGEPRAAQVHTNRMTRIGVGIDRRQHDLAAADAVEERRQALERDQSGR